MEVLVHYTTLQKAFENYNKKNKILVHKYQLKTVGKFYYDYCNLQNNIFFIVNYYNQSNNIRHFSVGKIFEMNDQIYFKKSSDEITNSILNELKLDTWDNYKIEYFYRVFTLNEMFDFKNRILEVNSNKIKLKYYDWEELLMNNNILFQKLLNILFLKINVLNLATTYNPDNQYTGHMLNKKYYKALEKIGFIDENGVKISKESTTLQGDIGEFLMCIFISEFFEENSIKYIYPKLIFKTNPKMSVYGNDGAIYVRDTNTLYYLEAKFYSKLQEAINVAVDSLITHVTKPSEYFEATIEQFRNVQTNRTGEIVELNEDTEYKSVVFAMCEDSYQKDNVSKIISNNKKLKLLRKRMEVNVFVLPVLEKCRFLETFKEKSDEVGENYYGE